MKVLVFGAGGQLGRVLARILASGEVPSESPFVVDRAPRSIDVRDSALVASYVAASHPNWIVNAAAMTSVDGAHLNPALAMEVNATGAAHIAQAASSVGAGLVQISTEAVFDGRSESPYREDDPCTPVSVYGVSKLAGEQLASLYNSRTLIVRTSWLYSELAGANFPTRLLQQLRAHDNPVPVVDDLFGNPTPASIVSAAVAGLIRKSASPGIYHACCFGLVSKYQWATAIAEQAGFAAGRIKPVSSDEFSSLARRPLRVDLSCARFAGTGILELPPWEQAAATTPLPE